MWLGKERGRGGGEKGSGEGPETKFNTCLTQAKHTNTLADRN